MKIPFSPSENALPPQQVHIIRCTVTPWPDGKRVKVNLELSPFQQPPNVTLVLHDQNINEISRVLLVETQVTNLSFTMHIRHPTVQGNYSLTASISYPEMGEFNHLTISFSIPQDNLQE